MVIFITFCFFAIEVLLPQQVLLVLLNKGDLQQSSDDNVSASHGYYIFLVLHKHNNFSTTEPILPETWLFLYMNFNNEWRWSLLLTLVNNVCVIFNTFSKPWNDNTL